jgi:hypothetical protein
LRSRGRLLAQRALTFFIHHIFCGSKDLLPHLKGKAKKRNALFALRF